MKPGAGPPLPRGTGEVTLWYRRAVSTALATSPESASKVGASCGVTVVELDFATKIERAIPIDETKASIAAGKFVWVDMLMTNAVEAKQLLTALGVIGDEIIDDALT